MCVCVLCQFAWPKCLVCVCFFHTVMSADDKEGTALKGLESGAAFFIMKPVNPDDLKDIWQFAAMKRKENQSVEIQEISDENPSSENAVSDQIGASVSSSPLNNEEATKTKEPKRKSPRKEGSDEERNMGESSNSQQKKPKIVWTNSLHNRFLEAIRDIGLDSKHLLLSTLNIYLNLI